jgi:hypothetical protein
MVYLHQDTKEGVGDVRGHEIATLLDTGALGIDGNYISAKLANEIDSQRNFRVLSNNVVICNGVDGSCVDGNYFLKLAVKLKTNVFVTLNFYILQNPPIDLIIGKDAITKHHILSLFPVQFGLIAGTDDSMEVTTPCTECSRFGVHTQCTECAPQPNETTTITTTTSETRESPLAQITTEWLAHYIAHGHLVNMARDLIPPLPSVTQQRKTKRKRSTKQRNETITTPSGTPTNLTEPRSHEIILDPSMSIDEPGVDPETHSSDEEYISDSDVDPTIEGPPCTEVSRGSSTILATLFVPVGSSLPEQLALEAMAQGVFSKRDRFPVELRQVCSIGSVARPIFGGVSDKSKVHGRIDRGPNIVTVADIRRKEELLTTLGENDDDDYIDEYFSDSYEPFRNRPEDDVNKLSKVKYGPYEGLNKKVKALVSEFKTIFSMTLPAQPAKLPPFDIKVNKEGWEQPKNRMPVRVQSTFKNEKIRELTKELEDSGIVQDSNAEYYSQAVLQPKPHTNKEVWRLCFDYRNLNEESEFQSHPLPNTSHMFDRIGAKKPKFFAVLDLTQGFHQIALSEASRKLTAFITHSGLSEYTRIPFGVKGAPPYFQQCLARIVLKGLIYEICELYIDDVIIFGETEEEFLANLRKVFERFKEYGIVIKPSKVQLGMPKIQYVGRELHNDGTKMQEEKTQKVLDFPLPEYIKPLRSFIGLAEYFRNHVIGDLSEVMRPLRKMVSIFEKAKTKLKWDKVPEAIDAFEKTKELIGMRAKLFFYDETAPIFLLTDASDYGIGAYLYQIIDGKERPVAFVSKSLSGPQLRWTTIQKEAFAIYYSITHLEYLLRDRSFCLMTDHANLVYINKSVNAMVQRWKIALGSYDFVVKHIQGIRNVVADLMSRLVKNHMLDEIKEVVDQEVKQEMILSLLHHDMRIPDEAYLKIKDVHNEIAGHGGVETTMNRLAKSSEPWTYMRVHVRHFIQTCVWCQKMSTIKYAIHAKPFAVATTRQWFALIWTS